MCATSLGVPEPYQSPGGRGDSPGQGGFTPPEEQMESGQVNPGTDLYALGMTALVLLTPGKDPDELYDVPQKDRWVWQEEVQVSAQLENVLTRLVAQRPPNQRLQSVLPERWRR